MSENYFNDFLIRTKGEFYLGIVGSVRSGKSTFIKKFMELKVLPYVKEPIVYDKIVDELPQSSAGKQIMTVEPKFIPGNTITIQVEDSLDMNVRLVDSVGWIIPNSTGYFDENGPRMVKTPWFEESIPFQEAAVLGTKKVIQNHSTLGIMMTSDGSFGDFSREDYESVEAEIITELESYQKPYVILLNSSIPNDTKTIQLANSLKEKYHVSCIPLNVQELTNENVDVLLKEALSEFELSSLNILFPGWVSSLHEDNPFKIEIDQAVEVSTQGTRKFKDAENIINSLKECPLFETVQMNHLDPKDGVLDVEITMKEEIYDDVITSLIGSPLHDKEDVIRILEEYIQYKDRFEGYTEALSMCDKIGYGIKMPQVKDLRLTSPQITKQGNRYGVRVEATAKSVHMISVDVKTVFEPIIGSEEQCKVLIENLLKDPDHIWDSEIFGRKLSDLVGDTMTAKIHLLPTDIQEKLRVSLEKIVNQGTGSMIAILL